MAPTPADALRFDEPVTSFSVAVPRAEMLTANEFAAVVFAVAGLALAFRRWSAATRVTPAAEDRALVDRALGR